ncbi:hypothetical protein ACFWIB_41590 [Streptomyces sp. NPDC127051]|uniref:hypothetical protein n=1 Tax=Streptomyces sp. NPDC127051 TaxID=3347119 RepID=UPI003656C59B
MLPTYTSSPIPFRTHEGSRFFQDLDRLLLLAVLPAQALQFFAFGAGQLTRGALAAVGLLAPDPVA